MKLQLDKSSRSPFFGDHNCGERKLRQMAATGRLTVIAKAFDFWLRISRNSEDLLRSIRWTVMMSWEMIFHTNLENTIQTENRTRDHDPEGLTM